MTDQLNQNGYNAVIENAKQQSEKVVFDANQRQDLVLDKLLQDLQKARESEIKNQSDQIGLLKKQTITKTAQSASQIVLSAKQTVLNQAFDKAKQAVLNFDDKQFLLFLDKLIVKYGENGDRLIFNKADKSRLPKDFLEIVLKKHNLKLSICDNTHQEQGGIIFASDGYDKDLTLPALFNLLKEQLEIEIASILFLK